ncbi:DUF1836 domain-containing protein [Clostridium ganghwense]|uniref:DUF1836 domain-containing protein n=1 Tax=Clostridium ganghwense TaxID=312089 RepID=A0ABT4CVQ1_9CLOT|nr:DUF1836 domain-containing protein [Clostridium ganghwense]MCY6372296.1 DUF1836 domain-containing protein [Clostridium ganghwense]
MEFTEKEIDLFIESLSFNKNLMLSDIPILDLYMDQVITLFENKLNHLKRNEDDKILTKTMINNYTKSKILMPPNKKKYTKDHIILLILIYNLKQSLSINDIGYLLKPIIKNLNEDSLDKIEIDKLYESFLKLKELEANNINKDLQEKVSLIKEHTQNLDAHNKDLSQMLITVLTLINEANMKKRLAEKIIDEFFMNL